ncbi:type I restriction enzyme HsdR N-terminal domain-containing protein [Arcanobacterium haemolyticum]|nr:type I restriction enzyme HsdR N-terminal domain-containing protein [Arcanobacterium haemolyticum]
MEFAEKLSSIGRKIEQVRDQLTTEEATKNALIMPFISTVLGYNVFDINEVVPEFTADVGLKKGEKVDYAIMQDGKVTMLIECKKLGQTLSLENANQLFRYFHVTAARIAILTNGEVYEFYTDLDSPNKMDEKPFLVLNLSAIDPALVPQVQKLAKTEFDLDSILSAAESLKYMSAIKRVMATQLEEIDADFLQLFLSRIYDGRITQRVRDDLAPTVQAGLRQFVSDQVNVRLKKALGDDAPEPAAQTEAPATEHDSEPEEDASTSNGIETTEEEIDAFHIVRAICCDVIEPERLAMRDAKSYCAILVDDNNRKPVCRLMFNTAQKYLGLLDGEKNLTREPIDKLTDLYKFREQLHEAVQRFL